MQNLLLALLLAIAGLNPLAAQSEDPPEVFVPEIVLRGIPFDVSVNGVVSDSQVVVQVNEDRHVLDVVGGEASVTANVSDSGPVLISVSAPGMVSVENEIPLIPGWLSLLPAVLAIVMALAFRQVIAALFAGIWVGAWMVYGLSLKGIWFGLLDTVERYVLHTLLDVDHMSVIIFSLMIGGMVGIISRNGGTMGIVNRISTWANSARKGQLSTAVLGVIIFFDDYANTLIVGNTMRPITDRLRISREKLAYLVDSTAAPVSTLFLVTTWIGFQVGLIDEAVGQIPGYSEAAYSVFLNSIPFSFYTVLALIFVFAVTISRRDFGPMYRAEVRARTTGQVVSPDAVIGATVSESEAMKAHADKPQRALNAFIPVIVLVFGTLAAIYVTGSAAAGENAGLREIIGEGNSFKSMMWASLVAVIVAAGLSLGQRILTTAEVVDAWYAGVKAMLSAIIILTLAWALSEVNTVLQTAPFLISALGEAVSPVLLPIITFLMSAATAFATGSSWGVMGIMMPLVVPVAWAVMLSNGLQPDPAGLQVMYASIAGVLAGAVWGDHCSPISDTTILSSMASQCDHIDHVRTQLPYAAIVGFVAVFFGLLPTGLGVPWYLSLVLSIAVLGAVLFFFGKRADDVVVGEGPGV